jgi:hypothetical protein
LTHSAARQIDARLEPLATAAAREETPSLSKMFSTWRFTVFGLRLSSRQSSRFEPPVGHQRQHLPLARREIVAVRPPLTRSRNSRIRARSGSAPSSWNSFSAASSSLAALSASPELRAASARCRRAGAPRVGRAEFRPVTPRTDQRGEPHRRIAPRASASDP